MPSPPTINSVSPPRAVEGGRVTLRGSGFHVDDDLPSITVGDQPARAVFASSTRIVIAIPADLEGGPAPVRIDEVAGPPAGALAKAGLPDEALAKSGDTISVSVASVWATGLHQVDNPVFDRDGN